ADRPPGQGRPVATMGIDRLAWRTLASRPLRSLLTIAGIALGVAVLCASLTLGAALDAAVQRTVNDMVGRADLRVSGFLEGGLSESAVTTISGSEDVADATPIVEHRTFPTSTPGGGTSAAITVLGIDPTSYLRLHDLRLVAGTMLDRSDEPVALVSQELADEDGYVLGGRISILGSGGETELRIVGILPGFGPVAGTGRTAIIPIDVARATFAMRGASHVDLQLAPGSLDSVQGHLAARMTEPYVLASPIDIAANLRA